MMSIEAGRNAGFHHLLMCSSITIWFTGASSLCIIQSNTHLTVQSQQSYFSKPIDFSGPRPALERYNCAAAKNTFYYLRPNWERGQRTLKAQEDEV